MMDHDALHKIVQSLLDSAPPGTVLQEKYTIRDERLPEAIATLIAAGADVNARDGYGQTPLYYCVSSHPALPFGTFKRVFNMLLAAGADVNRHSRSIRSTPLMYLAGWGRGDKTRERQAMLLAAGADPNASDIEGNTPLHLLYQSARGRYSQARRIETTELLLDDLLAAGADPTLRNAEGKTPDEIAQWSLQKRLKEARINRERADLRKTADQAVGDELPAFDRPRFRL